MIHETVILERYDTIPKEYEDILYKGISDYAFQKKGHPPLKPFSIFIKNQKQSVIGGVSGVVLYGSLYVDSLWIDTSMRHQGWGSKLMHDAEAIGREHSAKFATLSTMDWEALTFYQKLGYAVEFVREGYDKNSKMFLLRKKL